MGILGKDLFDLRRPRTNTKVEFGANGYWVENYQEQIPYGTVLTEVLNYNPEPLQNVLGSVSAPGSTKTVLRAFSDLTKLSGSLPLYRFYLDDFHDAGQWPIEQIFAGEALDAFVGNITSGSNKLIGTMRQRLEEIQFIQRRYGWFLDTISEGTVFEKKKGQRKEPLTERIDKNNLGPYVSGVSLGADEKVDAPQVNIQYALRERPDQEPELVERLYFDRLLDFVYVEFMRGMQKGFVPKRCASCSRWFLQTPGATYSYCDGPAPGQAGKTCREVGATTSFQSKVHNNEIWKLHQRAYKKYYARVMKKAMDKPAFETWARNAEQLRDRALVEYEQASEKDRPAIVDRLQRELNAR